MKHFISYFCTLAIALSMALQASASEPYFDSDGISYAVLSMDDRTVAVTAYTGESEAVSIPQQVTYEGTIYTVTTIGKEAFYDCSSLTSVTIPNSVTTIERSAFYDCTKLATIYCKILEPFFCEPEFPVEVITDATLYVPTGCKTKYETIAPWNSFKHIEEKPFSGVDNTPDDRAARILVSDGTLTVEGCECMTVYDMNGRIVYRGIGQDVRLAPGIYLVKGRNSCVKVVI